MRALAPRPAETQAKPLSLREEARVTGLSYSTIRRNKLRAAVAAVPAPAEPVAVEARRLGVSRITVRDRRLEAAAAAPAPAADLASVVAQLAASQSQTAAILQRMLDGEKGKEIRLPREARAEAEPKPLVGGTLDVPEAREVRVRGRRYILSSAQNNSAVHPVLASLQTMARLTGAEILLSRYTYNRNAWGNGAGIARQSAEVYYAPELEPYLVSHPVRIADDLIFAAELDRLPTTGDPLSGLDSYTRESSGVVGHPKVAMRSMARMKGEGPRMLYSTGTVTQRNYVDRLAGQKAAFHHVFGALFIEIDDDGAWFARQLIATENGEIQDLDTVYTPTVTRHEAPSAIVWGDIHRRFLEPWMREACWGQGGILDTLKLGVQVLHDVLHFTGRSHHGLKDPFLLAEHRRTGNDSVEAEIRGDAEFLAFASRPGVLSVLPDANHHQHLRRWLAESDFRMDPVNAGYGHWLAWQMHAAIDTGRIGSWDPYAHAVRHAVPGLESTRFLAVDESYEVEGVELGLHGDRGPNGARGSPKSFRQLGRRAVTGHTHTPGIVDGVWTVGVSGALEQGYNHGPSAWSHTHCLVYPSGKRALITMHGSRWRGAPVAKPRVRVPAGRAAA